MSTFTQTAILDTFESMLDRMSFEKITVSALIRECGISRNTFYYHYSDIFALLDDWILRALQPYDSTGRDVRWQDQVKALLHTCCDNKRRVIHIYHSLSRDWLEQYVFGRTDNFIVSYIRQQAAGRDIPEERLQAVSDILRYALYGFFLRFLWSGMNGNIDDSVEQLGALFEEILHSTLLDTNT